LIALDNGDKIRGDASAATVVDYTLHGLDNNAIKQLADGQLANTIDDLYTADSADVVSAIILVNTDSSARTVNLYLTPSGGTARRLIPKDTSLGVGFCLITDGSKMGVYDASGNLQQTVTIVAHALGGSSHDADTLSDLNSKISDATLVDTASIVLKALFDANTILAANSDDMPAALAVAASRILGRKAAGNIAAMTVAELLTLINVAAGADVTGSNAPQAHEASHVSGGSDDIDAALNPAAVALTTRGDVLFHDASGLARLAKGTDGQFLKIGANDPVWADVAAGAGEGHVTISLIAYSSIGQGTWTIGVDTGRIGNLVVQNTTTDDGDNISYKVYLATGTYTLYFLYGTGSDGGIIDFYIDAVEVASVDTYSGSGSSNNVLTQVSIVVTDGLKTLKLDVDGKNGSSSGYKAAFSSLILYRTA